MNRLFAMLAVGFLGLILTGCGGSGDQMAPDQLPTPTPAQLKALEEEAKMQAAEPTEPASEQP